MPKDRFICVEWEDASYNSGYYEREHPERYEPIVARTAGFLILKDRKKILISTDRFAQSGKTVDERYINTIPRKMVKKIVYLEPK